VRAFCSPRAASLCLLALIGLALAGCSTTQLIDSQVRSFTTMTEEPPADSPFSFRFERLPSQQAEAQTQDRLEDMALPVLAQKGLVPDAHAPRFALELGDGNGSHQPGRPLYGHWSFGTVGSGFWMQPMPMGLQATRATATAFICCCAMRRAKLWCLRARLSAKARGATALPCCPPCCWPRCKIFRRGPTRPAGCLIDLSPGGMQARP
jgi:hypothetical protein